MKTVSFLETNQISFWSVFSNSQFNFQENVVKVNCMKESMCSYLRTNFLYLMEDAFLHFSLYDNAIYH
jgi:hypothetical protein